VLEVGARRHPWYSDCAGLQGNGPLRERRLPLVRLVLTPDAITWVALSDA